MRKMRITQEQSCFRSFFTGMDNDGLLFFEPDEGGDVHVLRMLFPFDPMRGRPVKFILLDRLVNGAKVVYGNQLP